MTPLSIIIVAAPRSGTYWVVDQLQTRFQIHIPSETHFIPLFAKYLWLWGDLSVADNRRRLLGNIYAFIQVWTARSSTSALYLEQIRPLSLLATLDEGRADKIVEESSDYPSLVQALFANFADIHGVDASGDKSAHYGVLDPDRTFKYCPGAVMLHVIRDGRDVALSWMKQWFGPATVREAAMKWRDHIEVNREWGRRHPSRYLEIRYEDMATNREGEIRQLEIFLQRTALEDGAQSSGSALAKALSETAAHAGMLDIVASENIGKWKREMPLPDVALFEQLAGTALTESGYELSGAAPPHTRVTVPWFNAHPLRVAAKTLLPLVFGLSSRLGIPILAVINRRCPVEWRQVRL